MSSTVKTTKKDFELFKRECRKWIVRFGLKNWQVHYQHKADEGYRGQICVDLNGYIATIFLSKTWYRISYSDADIRKTAFHEVMHLLLARFRANAISRYVGPNEMDESEHEIIRTLESTVWE